MNLQTKFHNFRTALSHSLVERDPEIDLVLTSLIAKENPLLVGPPGTAKSQMLDSVSTWLDAPVFSYLLTKFTDPMELFGPIDLEHLKKGQNVRNVNGYMPTASLIFADEIFKASSAILNTLLKILNERTFKYGLQEFKTPLILCVAASNEWPNSETMQELGALFDRFLLRKKVRPVSDNGRKQLLNRAMENDDFRPLIREKITQEEIEQAHREALELNWTEETEEALIAILDELQQEGIFPGDRRIVKATKVIRCKAWLEGSSVVKPEHLEVLSHVLWVDPQEQPEKVEKVVTSIANPLGAKLYGFQHQMFDVIARANEKLRTNTDTLNRQRIMEEVINIGKELEKEIKERRETSLQIKILSFVQESRKNWERKLLQLPSK